VVGTGFASLNQLKRLHHLYLGALSLTPGSVAKLKPILPNLYELSLGRTALAKEECANFVYLTSVRHLDISFNRKIDNHSITYLSQLKNLQHLAINDTGITDKVLPVLLKMPKLNTVTVRPKEFWCNGKSRNQVKHLRFVDVAANSDIPSEALNPLH